MLRLIAACLALACLSLLLPSEPSYDPWAWLVWARELTHLELDTSGGPSWKPLPVAVLALAAPLGDDLSVALWVVVARAGALLALAFAFRLAGRLAGGPPARRALAGGVAAVALALTPDWLQLAAHTSEAPLAVALMLWAVERHLDGRREHAAVLGALVCLMRPELFPFLALYALWLWRAEPERRALVGAMMVAIPLAWLVPEWIGSGNPLDGGSQARSEPSWSLSHADQPWLRAALRAHNHAGIAVELLAATAIVAALVRRQGAVLVLAAAAAAEGALYLAMTQAGFSGNPRYVLPALVVGCVLAGVGAARIATHVPLPVGGAPRLAAAGLAFVLFALVATPFVAGRLERLHHEAREVGRRMELQQDLARAVEAAGGAEALRALGSATSNRALHSRLAWELGRPIQDVERGYGHSVVFRTRKELLAGRVQLWGRAREHRRLGRAGSVRVIRRIGVSYRLFTARLQVFHNLEPGGRSGRDRVVTQ
jgi:hypothetical protein